MKLRNKRRGDIVSARSVNDIDGKIAIRPEGYSCDYTYDSLAELNADWEDYAPDEPTTQQLEDSIKELDERLKTVEKLLKISGVGFCLIHNQDKPCKDCIRKIIEQIKKKNGEDYTPDELLITGEAGK